VHPAERDQVALWLHVPTLARIAHPVDASGRRAVFVPAAVDPWAAGRLHLAHITSLARRAARVRATDRVRVLPVRMRALDHPRHSRHRAPPRWAARGNRVPGANPSRKACLAQRGRGPFGALIARWFERGALGQARSVSLLPDFGIHEKTEPEGLQDPEDEALSSVEKA